MATVFDITPQMLDFDRPYAPLEAPWEKLAFTEIGETETKAKMAIEKLKKMIEDDGGFTCPTGDAFLLRFLRGRKYDMALSFRTIRKYCKIHTTKPKLFKIVPSTLEDEILAQEVIGVVQQRMPDGALLACTDSGKWDPNAFPIKDIFRACVLIGQYALCDPVIQVAGIVIVMNVKGLTMAQVRHVTPKLAHAGMKFIQDCFPVRGKAVHVINNADAFEIFFKIISPFISKENKALMHFHGDDVSSLHKHVSPSLLPPELGGTRPLEYLEENKKIVQTSSKLVKLMEVDYIKKSG